MSFRTPATETRSTGTHSCFLLDGLALRLNEAGPLRLLTLQSRLWAIESELHYCRDVTLGEDACRCKHRPMAQALASPNNLVIALLFRTHNANAAQA